MKRTPRQRSAFTGAAGVYAVASRLSLLNHTVYFPSVDEGVDILLGNGLRLQVKCGRYHSDPRTAGRYHILGPGRIKKYRKGQGDIDERKTYADFVDFVVYWAIEENRFFVFPASEVIQGIWITSKLDKFRQVGTNNFSYRVVREYEEAWNLLDTDSAIAEVEQQMAVVEELKES